MQCLSILPSSMLFLYFKLRTDFILVKMKKEIEFLQGAFESYKSSLHQDMDDKWNKRESDLKLMLQEEKQAAIHEMSNYLYTLRMQELK